MSKQIKESNSVFLIIHSFPFVFFPHAFLHYNRLNTLFPTSVSYFTILSCIHSLRLSPIWKVSQWALRAVPSERLCKLAQPRPPAAGWQPGRPLPTPVRSDVYIFENWCNCNTISGSLFFSTCVRNANT